jgi:hypothetical protein
MFPNLVYSNNNNNNKSTNKSDTNNNTTTSSTTDTTNNKNKKYTNSKLENECLIASLNARAVLFSSLISNNNNSGTISSIGSLMPSSNMFNNNSANPFSMVANEYFTSYLQALNQSIQFEKVIIIFVS